MAKLEFDTCSPGELQTYISNWSTEPGDAQAERLDELFRTWYPVRLTPWCTAVVGQRSELLTEPELTLLQIEFSSDMQWIRLYKETE